MILRHLKIENFRGIRTLEWDLCQHHTSDSHLSGRVLCLVGPNDSTKTSVLDAIELVLLPRSNPQVSDADFHSLQSAILIEATVGELPKELMEQEKYALFLRGYEVGKGISDDPGDGLESVITIRFFMDKDFEPEWTVFKESQEEARKIGNRDRERLGLARLGDDVDRHLTWARGSALSKLTENDGTVSQAFLEAARKARDIVFEANLDSLSEAASKATTSTKLIGANFKELKPGLDPSGLSLGNSVLGLHEANIPIRKWGLGTRRLAALAIQQSGIGHQSILLIDEIEHGLEPHRQRHLLARLSCEPETKESRKRGQVIFTSHSPTSIIALPVQSLRFVRSVNGKTIITEVNPQYAETLQGIARDQSIAFLGRKLLVCEGATEVGLCRGLEDYWASRNDGRHPSLFGFVAIDGKGRTNAPGIALELKRVGYDVAVLADSDASLEPDAKVLRSAGVLVFVWDGEMSTEQRLFADLPESSVQELLDLAFEARGEQSVFDQVANFCDIKDLRTRGKNFSDWIDESFTKKQARECLGNAAKSQEENKNDVTGKKKKNGWFKDVTLGTHVGEVVAKALPEIPNMPLAKTLEGLMKWIYG